MSNNGKCKFKAGDRVFTRMVVETKAGPCLPKGASLKVVEVKDASHIRCERALFVNGYLAPIVYCLSSGDIKKGV